jgi:hypothetical protein
MEIRKWKLENGISGRVETAPFGGVRTRAAHEEKTVD